MPTSAASVLVVVLAILPGLIGDYVYRQLIGWDWREREWRSVIRLIAFSVGGATLYALTASLFSWIPLLHLLPQTFQTLQERPDELNTIFLPYAGHVVGGSVAGLLAAWGVTVLSRFSPRSPFPSAWDDFVRNYSAQRWVIVGLDSGEVYAGRIATADFSVPAGDRDLVLAEPCLFDADVKAYRGLNYQYLFLKAQSIYSIAGVHDKLRDERIVGVGETLFEQEPQDEP